MKFLVEKESHRIDEIIQNRRLSTKQRKFLIQYRESGNFRRALEEAGYIVKCSVAAFHVFFDKNLLIKECMELILVEIANRKYLDQGVQYAERVLLEAINKCRKEDKKERELGFLLKIYLDHKAGNAQPRGFADKVNKIASQNSIVKLEQKDPEVKIAENG